MASKEWTQEQRERAAEQVEILFNPDAREGWRKEHVLRYFEKPMRYRSENIAIDLQCSLNLLQEQVNEALGIIEQYPKAVRGLLAGRPVRNVPHLEAAFEKWL